MSDALRLRYAKDVQALSEPLERLRKNQLSLAERLELVTRYEELTSQLYRIRNSFSPTDPLRLRAEDFLSSLSQELLTQQKERPRVEDSFSYRLKKYRFTWKQNFSLFVFCLIFFLISLAVGWILVNVKPESATLFMSQDLIERIIDNKAWFHDIENPFLVGLKIAFHNMKVALMCYIFSGIFGVGGLWFLAYNGLYFGAVFAFCNLHRFDEALGSFVIAHGILELTLIVCATFAGLLLGRVFFMRPRKFFQRRIQMGAAESMVIVGGVIPWFLLCGLVESFLSPLTDIPVELRWTVGALIAFVFWIWTLWPLPTQGAVLKEV